MTPHPPIRSLHHPAGMCFCRSRRARTAAWRAIFAAALVTGGLPAAAQTDPATALASRSAIVVLGTVVKVGASDEPLLAPSSATAVIKIDKMYAGSEVAGDQAGHNATVILSKPGGVKVGDRAVFFGNPRYIGKTITIADEGELPAPQAEAAVAPRALEAASQARRDAPLRARLATAELVFRGTVENVRALESGIRGKKTEPRDEHDPDWQVAMVRVTSSFQGAHNGAVVPVVFAASKDIMWFKSPKLRAGEAALIIGQRPQEGEAALLRATAVSSYVKEHHAVLVTNPFDVLPASDEQHVVELLHSKEVQQ
jgi:hypothetical protein